MDIRPLGAALATTRTLVKTDALTVVRMVVPAGKEIPNKRHVADRSSGCVATPRNRHRPAHAKGLRAS